MTLGHGHDGGLSGNPKDVQMFNVAEELRKEAEASNEAGDGESAEALIAQAEEIEKIQQEASSLRREKEREKTLADIGNAQEAIANLGSTEAETGEVSGEIILRAHSVDVDDKDSVNKFLSECRQEFGKIGGSVASILEKAIKLGEVGPSQAKGFQKIIDNVRKNYAGVFDGVSVASQAIREAQTEEPSGVGVIDKLKRLFGSGN